MLFSLHLDHYGAKHLRKRLNGSTGDKNAIWCQQDLSILKSGSLQLKMLHKNICLKVKGKGHGLWPCSRLSLLTRLYPLAEPVHSCTISTPWGALHYCNYRHWLTNHNANFAHIPGTRCTAGWMGSTFLLIANAGLDLATLW